MWFLALFTLVGSGLVLAFDVFPGVLEQYPNRIVARVVGGVWLVAACLLAIRSLVRRRPPDAEQTGRASAILVLVLLAVTPTLLVAHAVRRAVFAGFRSDFESLLAKAPPAGNQSVVALNEDLAIFWIDQWGTDARGGTYFRTLLGHDEVGIDRRSFGFAYRPNREGSPFGDADYVLNPMGGDWYSFAASPSR